MSRSVSVLGVPITPGYGPSTISRQPYTDPVQFEMERERVLNTTWLIAGRSSELVGTGDWLSFESHGETAVVTRQADGSLAAFHNVCQHRGPTFVTEWRGCGAKRFTCPYHGWMYDTTGKVIGCPGEGRLRRGAVARPARRLPWPPTSGAAGCG